MTNQVEVIWPQTLLQPEEISEVHVCNPNYKGKNYDPNFQAKHVETAHTASHNNKQPQQASTVANQATKDFGYMEQEFVEAVEMYQYFSN